ncbi:MAG: aspartate aminotransferase family protein [Defluviitaleaceae bacterium]|nr:aspartate aminotransferase family protein [Defluviitaleaceae bacterium]MCL2263646.1 aspartate aminotransferase family protein [Defluviitaleaceae bacterium]
MTVNFNDMKNMYDENICATYGRYPVAFVKGAGSRLWDSEGKEYVDFASGIGVNSVGHSHPKWVDAVCAQVGVLAHVSNLFYTEQGGLLAEKLTALSGTKKAFFCNSGAESVEGVIKTARKYSSDKYGANRHTIITLQGSFHGRTMAALTATGQDKFHKHFHPFVQGFRYVPPNDFAALEAEAKAGDVCAFMFEPIMGEGGVMPLDTDYLQKAAQLCEKNDWLLIADEVQTGVGRTGKWFGFQNHGIQPDAITFAKGIAGALPLGGFLLGDKLHTTLGAGDHGTTYGGNPICAAAALSVLEILEPVLPSVTEKGTYIREKILAMNLPCVKEIRGCGLMLGIKLDTITNTEAVSKLLAAGLVTLPAGIDILRFLPPLTISTEDIDAGLSIIKKTL